MRIPFHTCPTLPERLSPEDLQERLEFFFQNGLLPYWKSHALSPVMPSDMRDMYIDNGWYVRPDGIVMGWVIHARAIDNSQGITGAVCKTLEEALEYAENELMKLLEIRGREAAS